MMSVACESNNTSDTDRIRQPGFVHGMWICNSPETGRFTGDDNRSSKFSMVKTDDDSSSSSSIGKNSDASGDGGDSDDDNDGEVQSSVKGSFNTLHALEDALPVKRGISTFYAGKSKSYTSLEDVVSVPSIQDIVKPEDAYNRKRKNMIAHSVLLDKNRKFPSSNGISKRFANSNRNASALGLNKIGESSNSLPPLPARPKRLPANELLNSSNSSPRIYSTPWRSLSLSDLQHAAGATSNVTVSLSNKRDNEDR